MAFKGAEADAQNDFDRKSQSISAIKLEHTGFHRVGYIVYRSS
jgi:hypothetical protein